MASTYKTCNCPGCFETIIGDSEGVDLCDACDEADCDAFADSTECGAQQEEEPAPRAPEHFPHRHDDVCAGEGHLLGVLGYMAHYRCRACGTEFHLDTRDL